MLEPVTRKYTDESTMERFGFTFYCDRCGKAVKSVEYPYRPPFRAKLFLSASERQARELIWQKDHDAAYERANKDVLLSFNRCPQCGDRVCDECFSDEGSSCKQCEAKQKESEGCE